MPTLCELCLLCIDRAQSMGSVYRTHFVWNGPTPCRTGPGPLCGTGQSPKPCPLCKTGLCTLWTNLRPTLCEPGQHSTLCGPHPLCGPVWNGQQCGLGPVCVEQARSRTLCGMGPCPLCVVRAQAWSGPFHTVCARGPDPLRVGIGPVAHRVGN